MTKSTITRERIELIANFHRAMTLPPSHDEIEELARMTLVAMDSEPVAWTWHYREQWHVTNDKCRAEFVAKDGDMAVLPLYRHAQPVPVVPEEKSIPNTLSMYAVDAVAAIAEVKGWNACRAAMLHAGNSPAQSDCCPAQNHVSPEQNGDAPAQSQGWIQVSERMPENDGAYLCWDNRYVTTYAFIFGAWQANQFIAKNITHWMPLPAGPQEVR